MVDPIFYIIPTLFFVSFFTSFSIWGLSYYFSNEQIRHGTLRDLGLKMLQRGFIVWGSTSLLFLLIYIFDGVIHPIMAKYSVPFSFFSFLAVISLSLLYFIVLFFVEVLPFSYSFYFDFYHKFTKSFFKFLFCLGMISVISIGLTVLFYYELL